MAAKKAATVAVKTEVTESGIINIRDAKDGSLLKRYGARFNADQSQKRRQALAVEAFRAR